MHFDQWPVWATKQAEEAGKTGPLSQVFAEPHLITQAMIDREGINRSAADIPVEDLRLSLDDFVKKYRFRKKPGPKPKVKP